MDCITRSGVKFAETAADSRGKTHPEQKLGTRKKKSTRTRHKVEIMNEKPPKPLNLRTLTLLAETVHKSDY